VEIEFYEFYKQRLHNQLKSVEKSVENSDNLKSWPDQVVTNEFILCSFIKFKHSEKATKIPKVFSNVRKILWVFLWPSQNV